MAAETMSARPRLDVRIVVWALLFVFFGFFMTIGGTYPWLGLASARALVHGGFAAIGLVWALAAWRSPSWRPRRALVVPVAAVLLAAVLSAISSPIPRIAFEAVIAGSCLAEAFLLMTCLAANQWFRPRLTQLLVLFAILLVVGYAIELTAGWVRWFSLTHSLEFPLRPGGASLTFGAIAAVAALLLLVVPFAFAILWQAGARRLALALGGVALLELAVTGSRAAYVGAGVSGLVAAMYWARARKGAVRQQLVRAMRTGLVVGIPVAAVVAIAFASPLVARLFDLDTVSERFAIWESAAKLFAQRPTFGNGPGTWTVLSFATYPTDAHILVVSHAHNTIVQLAVDIGIVGIVCIGVLLATIGVFLSRATRSNDPKLRYPSIAIAMGFAGFIVLSLFDHLVNIGAIVLVLGILAAWAISGVSPLSSAPMAAAGRQPPGPRLVAAVLLIAVASTAVPVASSDRAAFAAEGGIAALQRGDWKTAKTGFEDAIALDPGFLFYSYELAAVQALDGEIGAARTGFAKLATVDRAPWVLLSLAYLDMAEHDLPAALNNARSAFDRGFGDAEIALNVGAIAEAAGDTQLALHARASAVAYAPAIAGSPYWASTATPADVVNQAARSLLSSQADPVSQVTAALVRAYGGDISGARQELLRLPPTPDVSRALAVAEFEEGSRAAAITMLEATLKVSPSDVATLRLLARYSQITGDPAAAKSYKEWIGLLGGAYGGWAEFVPTGVRIRSAREALTSNFPPAYPWAVYLRMSPPLLTPPDYLVIDDDL